MLKKLCLFVMVLVITGCASKIQKIPSEAGVSEFTLDNVNVNLILGDNAIEGDTTFASQNDLQQQFQSSITKYLKKNNLLAVEKSDGVAELNITIDYTRRFNWGGKALNKPEVSHVVDIYKGGENILTFSESGYTTKYSYLQDVAVNVQIASFTWDEKDEPKDIDLVSSLIVKDIIKRLD